jgi:hypothetical protein
MTPVITKTLYKNPARILKYRAMFNSIENISKRELGLSDDDLYWMKKRFKGAGLVLPWRDASGLPIMLDLSFILPWGFLLDPTSYAPGGLALSMYDAIRGWNPFTRKDLYLKEDPNYIKASETINQMANVLGPSWMPGSSSFGSPVKGGANFRRMMQTLSGRGDRQGRVRGLTLTFLDTVLGFKTVSTDPMEQEFYYTFNRLKGVDDIVKKLQKIWLDQSVDDQYKWKAMDVYSKQIDKILMELVEKK